MSHPFQISRRFPAAVPYSEEEWRREGKKEDRIRDFPIAPERTAPSFEERDRGLSLKRTRDAFERGAYPNSAPNSDARSSSSSHSSSSNSSFPSSERDTGRHRSSANYKSEPYRSEREWKREGKEEYRIRDLPTASERAAPSFQERDRTMPPPLKRTREAFERSIGPTFTPRINARSSYEPSFSRLSSNSSSSSSSQDAVKPRSSEDRVLSNYSSQHQEIGRSSQPVLEEIENSVKDLLDPTKKPLSPNEGRKLCAQIKGRQISFDQAVRLASQHQASPFIINAILNKEDPKARDAWLFKKELFKHMRAAHKTPHNINVFIRQAGKNGQFDEAKKAFDAAVASRQADTVTYASYIDASGKNGEFDEAKKAFDAAVASRQADAVTYNNYIDVAGKKGEFTEAKKAFQAAVDSRRADTVTIIAYIGAAGKNGRFAEAKKAFDAAVATSQVDVFTYASYIDVAAKKGEFDEAKKAFEHAVASRQADVFTYTSYIDAAGKRGC